MIKFVSGSVTNPETGVTKDIVVKAKSPVNIKYLLIYGSAIVFGFIGLINQAFADGAHAMERGEIIALSEAGLLEVYNP